jgi:hypothetical protein
MGTTYVELMARYPSIIAVNIARVGTPARSAHAKVQTTPATGFKCSNVIIASTGHGTREVEPFEGGWICQVGQVLFDEFITSPACAGRARCAMTQTLVYFAKHKSTLTPIEVWTAWGLAIQFSIWGTNAVEEMYRMCANTEGCLDTQGLSPQCSGIDDIGSYWQCVNGTAYNMQIIDENLNNPVVVGDAESNIEGYIGGDFTVADDSYDASFGYGSWGLLTEMGMNNDYGSCFDSTIPWCPG